MEQIIESFTNRKTRNTSISITAAAVIIVGSLLYSGKSSRGQRELSLNRNKSLQALKEAAKRDLSYTESLLNIAEKGSNGADAADGGPDSESPTGAASGKRGKKGVSKEFWTQLKSLLKIAFPSLQSKEVLILALHSLFLIFRTYLSVVGAVIDGQIVKHLTSANGKKFLLWILYWFLISIPSVFTNGMIKFLQGNLSIAIRNRLTSHAHKIYFSSNVFYKTIALDNRIENADQLLTTDIQKFAQSFASVYSAMTKPLLDLVIFNYQLSKSIGVPGLSAMLGIYFSSSKVLRYFSPNFGRLAAREAKLEGQFRFAHTRLITNAEEIAFYKGNLLEQTILDTSYLKLISHVNRIYRKKISYNMLEDILIKYLWSAIGLIACSIPILYPRFAGSQAQKSQRVEDYTEGFIRDKRLMLSLADAGGRLLYSYKDLAELAGYASRVSNMLEVFGDLVQNKFSKVMVSRDYKLSETFGLRNVGGLDWIQVQDAPVVSPSGELLVQRLNFEVKQGQHLLITGPNGVGKSSIMRVLSGIWPLFLGSVKVPGDHEIMYIPQRPYLYLGTLRDQVIYPDSPEDMKRKGIKDEDLMQFLSLSYLEYIPSREGGWDTVKEWKDVFSGGEKQRIGLARVFYHQPRFAVLDESTSAVSADVEGFMYEHAKEMGITLVTISHRPSLIKYHQYMLALTGEKGQWRMSVIGSGETGDRKRGAVAAGAGTGTEDVYANIDREIKQLKKQLESVPKLQARLEQVKQELNLKH